ncbi:MAG: Surface exclusion protein Sea1 [Actinomycetia bacterium]|nr:Surface exclusion protein Sea1 [Actinomycetes bacterium]
MTDLDQLRQRLQVLLAGSGSGAEANRLVLSETLFGPGDPLVRDLLGTWNGGQPLVVHQAVLAAAGTAPDDVVMTGTTSFRSVDGAPVTVRFRPVAGGVAIRARIALPVTWRFSQSFPDLPLSIDFRAPLTAAPSPLFDMLTLTGAALVLATHDHVDEELKAALPAGLGFVAQLKLVGLFGVIEHTLGGGRQDLVIAGPIVAAPPVPTTPLPPQEPVVPVPSAAPLPGINLRAVLDTEVTLGPLSLRNTALVLYCPPDAAWLEQYPQRPPMVFYGGTLHSGDRFAVEVWAALDPGGHSIVLTAQPEGGLAGIRTADLAGLLGGDELAGQLGPQLGSLGTITLQTMSLSLSPEPPTLDRVSATVALDGIHWAPFGDVLVVTDIHAIVAATSPLSKSRSVQVILAGRFAIENTQFTVVITVPDFTISVDVTAQPTLPLATFMHTYLPDVPPVGDLTVDRLRLTARPGASYNVMVGLAPHPAAWTLQLGPQTLEISDVTLALGRATGTGFTGSFSGHLALAGVGLDVGFQVPGPFAVRADLPQLSLITLVNALTDQPVQWPPGFDIVLDHARIRIEKRGSDLALILGAQVEGFGSLAVDIRRAATHWGMAAGFALPTGWRLGQLSQELAPLDQAFHFDRMVLVIASFDDPGFEFPDLSAFGDPTITSPRITLPAGAAPGVKAGLNAFAEMDLGSDRGLKLIKDSLHLDHATLDVLVQIGINPVTALVSAGITGSFNGNLQFTGALRVQLAGGSPSVGLLGKVALTANGQPLEFTAELSITPNGALLAGTMPDPWHDAFGVHGLVLSGLALLVGISWELIPAIGIAATMSLGDFAGSAALLFDGTQPTRSLLAGSISDLTLNDIAKTLLAGQAQIPDEIAPVLAGCRLEGTHLFDVPATLAADFDTADVTPAIAAAFLAAGQLTVPTGAGALLTVAEPGRRWHLTDRTTLRHYGIEQQGDVLAVSRNVQLYLAPEPTLIGQLSFPAGTRLTAGLTAFGFGGHVDVDVDPNAGISASAALLPIDAGVIFTLTGSGGTGEPRFSLATYDAPGAPVRGPHCLVSGAVTMLGFTQDIDLRLSRDGFSLTVSATIFNVFGATVTASLPLRNFAAAELSIGASMHDDFLTLVRTQGAAAIQSAAGDATRAIGDAQRNVTDAQTNVTAIQAQIDPQVAQIRAERAQADTALRNAQDTVNTIQQQIDAEQNAINGLTSDRDQLKGQLTFWNAVWIGPQILDKERQIAQHQLTLAGEQAALAAAQGTLNGLRAAISTTPVEADPRVAGLYAQLAVEQAGLTSAQNILAQTQATVGDLASVATWLADHGPDHLLDVTQASFTGSLGVVNGGQVTLTLSYVLLAQPGSSTISFDFHDVQHGIDALVNLLKQQAAALAPRG